MQPSPLPQPFYLRDACQLCCLQGGLPLLRVKVGRDGDDHLLWGVAGQVLAGKAQQVTQQLS